MTRFGRFLDSLGDFYTNLLIFAAIGVAAMRNSGGPVTLLLWLTCFWAMTLQCSYFNYYFIAFLQQSGRRPASRLDEGIRPEDRSRSAIVLWLQRLYLWTYGWQDDLVAVLERATGPRVTGERRRRAWYGDSGALRISSFLGLGTLLMPLALLAIMDQLSFYLLYVFVVSDLVLLGAIIYRAMLAKRLIEIE